MSSISVTTEPIARPELANLSLLLSKAFSSPVDFKPSHPQSCGEMAAGLPPSLQRSGTALAEEWEHALLDRDAVLRAYARLFVGPFEIQAPPYASHYLEPDRRLMGDVSMWVAEAYAESGLDPAEGPREAPDHVALEWEYLYYLGYQSITLQFPDSCIRAQSFIDEHMIKWIPHFAEAILASDTHPYYHALARFAPPFVRFLGTKTSQK